MGSMKFIGLEVETVGTDTPVAAVVVVVRDTGVVVDLEVMDVDEVEDILGVEPVVDAAPMNLKIPHIELRQLRKQRLCLASTLRRFSLLVLQHQWRTGMLQYCMCYNGWIAWIARIEGSMPCIVYCAATAFPFIFWNSS